VTVTDPKPLDREWTLRAARGEIDTGGALDTVRFMRWDKTLEDRDPELWAALQEGDAKHPDDKRRWPTEERPPWELDLTHYDTEGQDRLDRIIESEWAPDDPIFVHWPTLWDDDDHTEWLYDNVLALGRGHAIYAQHKQGKSLFVLWVCAQLAAKGDTDIVYLDYEMTRDDLRERLDDMGYGPDSNLERLHYALLPSLPPLDTGEGAGALLELCDQVQTPERHLFVVIDTTARAVEGDENSNDTIREFYRWTGTPLKRRQITWARLDHAGKDPTRGQRGGSAKGDDVDIIWRLTQQDEGGIKLHRDASRMSWVPEHVTFGMTREPLAFVPGIETWPEGTKELVVELEALNVPLDASYNTARKLGVKGRKTAVLKALKFRVKDAERHLTVVPENREPADLHVTGNRGGNQPAPTPLTSGSPNGNQPEPVQADVRDLGSPPKGEPVPSGTHPDPSKPSFEPTRTCRCGAEATDLSGLCPGCIANPGTPHQELDF
jgi:AAA domain